MNKRKFFVSILVATTLIISAANAQITFKSVNNSNDTKLKEAAVKGKGKVTCVVLEATPTYMKGCSNDLKHFEFVATITTDGPCTVQYEWLRSDLAKDTYAPRTLVFSEAGSQNVKDTWDLSVASYSGWKALKVTAPNTMQSNYAKFVIPCENTTAADCKNQPFVLTACAKSLLTSFTNLISGNGVRYCNPTGNFPTITSSMPEACFFNLTDHPGETLTYATLYRKNSAATTIQVIFGDSVLHFRYYGACAPDPIHFLHPELNNHVYAVKFVRKSEYAADILFTNVAGLKIEDIAEIVSFGIEDKTGFIGTNESVNYNRTNSSKGVMVVLKMKNGNTEECYLINNHDPTHFIITWKEANPLCR